MRYAFKNQQGQVVICAEVPLSITAQSASTEAPAVPVITTPVPVTTPASTPVAITDPDTTPDADIEAETTPDSVTTPEPIVIVPNLKTIIQVRDAITTAYVNTERH